MADAQTAGGYAKEITEDEKQKQADAIKRHIAKSDACITTALIPGRRAPILITAEMVRGMRPGSVIVDLAAEQGGNCALTQPGLEIEHAGVTIVGLTNVASLMPADASRLYARNVSALLEHLAPGGELALDFDDEITAGACVTRPTAEVAA